MHEKSLSSWFLVSRERDVIDTSLMTIVIVIVIVVDVRRPPVSATSTVIYGHSIRRSVGVWKLPDLPHHETRIWHEILTPGRRQFTMPPKPIKHADVIWKQVAPASADDASQLMIDGLSAAESISCTEQRSDNPASCDVYERPVQV